MSWLPGALGQLVRHGKAVGALLATAVVLYTIGAATVTRYPERTLADEVPFFGVALLFLLIGYGVSFKKKEGTVPASIGSALLAFAILLIVGTHIAFYFAILPLLLPILWATDAKKP